MTAALYVILVLLVAAGLLGFAITTLIRREMEHERRRCDEKRRGFDVQPPT
jgi:hypothetical protein